MLVVLSTFVLSTVLTGCDSESGSDGYDVVLDQPASASLSETATSSANTVGQPALSESLTTPEDSRNDVAVPNALTETTKSDSPIDSGNSSAGNASTGDTTVAEPRATASAPVETVATAETKGAAQPANPPSDAASQPQEIVKPDAPAEAVEKKPPRIVTLLIPDKTFKTEGKEKALRVSFDDFDLLKILNMDPVTEDAPSRMPKWLKDLDGKRIRVRGFMFPPFEEENIRAFTLARDNQICCFGRNPLVYDLVDVFMRKGESTDYIQGRPFDVIGIFHIGDSIVPGELYSMDDSVVVDQ
ncbi:MAG: hypothetical protein HQ518_22530 [Rhodopirellula sp.]|nr:hypothetical protein [Rhodopirellula sp.]